jgi:ATP-binding cassette subfamily B protein
VIGLLRTHLAPYRRDLLIVISLLVAQVLGTLYLPELNADIINNGVATGTPATSCGWGRGCWSSRWASR